jgi:hypothetical protein
LPAGPGETGRQVREGKAEVVVRYKIIDFAGRQTLVGIALHAAGLFRVFRGRSSVEAEYVK